MLVSSTGPAVDHFDDKPHPMPFLDDYIDLSPLGASDRGQLRERPLP